MTIEKELKKHKSMEGYVKILVGIDHPMADNRGYCYEHRLVMAEVLGRYLESTERVHHRNYVRDDNRIVNLVYAKDEGDHKRMEGYYRRNKLIDLNKVPVYYDYRRNNKKGANYDEHTKH